MAVCMREGGRVFPQSTDLAFIELKFNRGNFCYVIKCECGYEVDVKIFFSGILKEGISLEGGECNYRGCVKKELQILFCNTVSYARVTWDCCQCDKKITLIVTRYLDSVF